MGKNGGDDDEKQQSNVYIMDPDFGWRPAVLEGEQGDFAIVSVPEYKDEQSMACDGGRLAKSFEKFKVNLRDYPHRVLPLQNVDANACLVEYPDMVRLPYLHEPAILYNMKKRHMSGKPYTRTGDIIIAINPFQWFHELYTEKKRSYYSNRLVWDSSGDDDPRDKIEPHVYEVSSLAYKGLAFEHANQSILVSGESGAGKTETVKICMNHIASVQRGPGTASGDELDPVVQRVVESNPLLEAFGNAKTQRNDNSSRFGKYLQLQFDSSTAKHGDITDRSRSRCVLAGSKCDVYLLEKNRVTGHSDKERTYHIFYQLLAAPDSDKAAYWPKLKGKTNKDFKYIGHTDTTKIEGMTDAQHYDHTVKTLALINITGDRLATLMRAIAIVMQCGNLTFGAKGGDKDRSDITSKAELADLAGLMGVSEPDLTCAFTERTMKTKTESYKVPLNQDAAKDACDAFAKEVYGKVFLWLVKEINAATCAEDNYKGPATEFGIVGLLDIFGFESFVVNRFEQLCINYANEKLQQKFTEDVFRAVQLEYEAEGIELAEITYDDNTDVLDLIEGRTGLLALLNEECVRPKGNDQQFVQKALQQNASSPCLIVNKMDRMSFGIHHYAGKVMYDADQFVTRNQDTLPTDLEDIGMKSSNEIVSKKLEEPPKEPAAGNRKTLVRQKSNIVAPTVWGKYKTQLHELMANLRKTNSRYIRCIKPNMKKVPVLMEHIPTIEQLRCAGVVAAVTLARSAFPNRLDNASVRFRYGSMWEKSQYPSAKTSSMDANQALRCDCDAILHCALKSKETVNDEGKVVKAYVVGRTKSYFRAGALEYLEANRKSGLDGQATTIQRFARGWLVRKQVGDYAKRRAAEELAAKKEKERAEREAREKYEREKAERQAKRDADRKKYSEKIENLKKALKDADHDRKSRLSSIKEAKEALERDIEELRDQTNEDARKAANEPKKIVAQQKKKLEEQTKMIDLLKKENKKYRKEAEKIKTKFDLVRENNDKLLRANEEAGNNFEATDSSSMRVHERNEKLTTTLETAKADNKRMKDECMAAQDKYMSQAETRLEYQKAMARILNMIQDTLRDPQLIEDTVCLALECESEAKSVMAALEAETEEY